MRVKSDAPTAFATPLRLTLQFTILLLAALLASCSQAQTDLPYAKPDGWITHCIGRYLVDMPPKAIDPAAVIRDGPEKNRPLDYDFFGGYAPPNEGDFALGYVRYDSYQIGESLPVDNQTFQKFVIPGVGNASLDLEKDSKNKVVELAFDLQNFQRAGWRSIDRMDIALRQPDNSVLSLRRDMHDQDQPDAGAAERAWKVISDFQSRYRQRDPLDIPAPSVPGVCTPRGFISEQPGEALKQVELRFVPYQNPDEPALVYKININESAQPASATSIETLRLPHAETDAEREQRKRASPGFRGGGWERAFNLDFGPEVQRRIAPEFFSVGGQPGRLTGVKFSVDAQLSYAAYAQTLGKPGDVFMPEITLLAYGLSGLSIRSLEKRPKPPDLDIAHKTLRSIARSLRLRVPQQQ